MFWVPKMNHHLVKYVLDSDSYFANQVCLLHFTKHFVQPATMSGDWSKGMFDCMSSFTTCKWALIKVEMSIIIFLLSWCCLCGQAQPFYYHIWAFKTHFVFLFSLVMSIRLLPELQKVCNFRIAGFFSKKFFL